MILDGPLAPAGHDDDAIEPGGDRLLDDVLDHGLVDERQHLLGLGLRRRQEAGAEARGGEHGGTDAHATDSFRRSRRTGRRAARRGGPPWRRAGPDAVGREGLLHAAPGLELERELLERGDAGVQAQDRLGLAARTAGCPRRSAARAPSRGGRRPGPCRPHPGPGAPADVFLVVHRDLDDQTGPPGGVQTERGQLAVRHDAQLARELADLGDAEPDRLDDARVRPDLDHVADRDQVLEEEEEAQDDVLDQALGPEADRQPGHPGRDDERAHVDADLLQDDDHDQEPQQVAGMLVRRGPECARWARAGARSLPRAGRRAGRSGS